MGTEKAVTVPFLPNAGVDRPAMNVLALHEALLMNGAMAHVRAHDLRTPLNTMTGLLHLLKARFADDLPEKVSEYIDYMSSAAKQMDDIIADALDTTQQTAAPRHLVAMDMRRCLDTAIAALVDEVPAARIEVSGPSWTLTAEPVLLHLMFTHLLRNAVQHPHPDRPLKVHVTLLVESVTHPTIRITDTGTGYPAPQQHALFVPAKADAPPRLGLVVCREVCRRHGWQIAGQSDGKSGAIFEVVCPASSDDVALQ